MREITYFDTSALAKWYLNEPRSDDVEKYIQEHGPVAISDLTVVEMRCLLARRRRERSIDSKMEIQVFATFQEDIRQKSLVSHSLPDGLAAGAVNLLSVLSDLPLRTLDALHLVIAREMQADTLATADRIMVAGAEAMGFLVVRFGRKQKSEMHT
jgi:predicted nucleic acid-binding protein